MAISIRVGGIIPLPDRTTVVKGMIKVENLPNIDPTTTPTKTTINLPLTLLHPSQTTAGNPLPPLDPILSRSKVKNPRLPLPDSINPSTVLRGTRKRRTWTRKRNTPLQLPSPCMVLTSLGLVLRESTSFPSSLNVQRTDSQLRGSIQKRSQSLFDAGTPRGARTHEDCKGAKARYQKW